MKPKVTVIMPVLNGQKYIAEAIGSIAAQTFQDFELIVVNDGSTDRTCEILESFSSRMRLRIIHHAERQGIPRSMNDGLRAAEGSFITFLDHDDGWFPNFLETQFAWLQAHPETAMVHSDFQTIDENGHVIESSVAKVRKHDRPSGNVFAKLFFDSFIVGNSVMIRRECFDRVGLVDESLRWGDYHMWLRIARHYQLDYVPKVLTTYRQHSSQSTRTGAAGSSAAEDPMGLIVIRKILELYPEVWRELGERPIRKRMASFHYDLAYYWHVEGDSQTKARAHLRRAIAIHPAELRQYKFYIQTMLPRSQVAAMVRVWRRLQGSTA